MLPPHAIMPPPTVPPPPVRHAAAPSRPPRSAPQPCRHPVRHAAALSRPPPQCPPPCRGSVEAAPASRLSRALPRWPLAAPSGREKIFSPHGWLSARCVSAEFFLKKSREKIWPCRPGAVILHRFSPQAGALSARKSSLTWWREQQRCSTKGHQKNVPVKS